MSNSCNDCEEIDIEIDINIDDSCNDDPKPCFPHNYCRDRVFCGPKNEMLRSKLGRLNNKQLVENKVYENKEEEKYKKSNYCGLFTKGLQHDSLGNLSNNSVYENLKDCILFNHQYDLNEIPMAQGCKSLLVSPLASICTPLVGAPQYGITIPHPASMSSDQFGAEMVELYAHMIARDVPFDQYHTDPTIQLLLTDIHLNKPNVVDNLQSLTFGGKFTPQTVFRGRGYEEMVGPLVSQLIYLDVPIGGATLRQLFDTPHYRSYSLANNFRVE
jgi:hypothetical protein